jgi:dihydrofolate reductase
MRNLLVFNQVSLDGFIADAQGDMRWAHKDDAEWRAFTEGNAAGGGELLFGRVTYDLMASYWPTPMALQANRAVAERMNSLPKVVFSRTVTKPKWSNTRLVKGDIAAAVRKMKAEPGPGMVILGSGSIVSQLAPEGLIDEYQLVLNPIILGAGKSMFAGVSGRLNMALVNTRAFENGNVLLRYRPAQ